jgi:hypothetical protein
LPCLWNISKFSWNSNIYISYLKSPESLDGLVNVGPLKEGLDPLVVDVRRDPDPGGVCPEGCWLLVSSVPGLPAILIRFCNILSLKIII